MFNCGFNAIITVTKSYILIYNSIGRCLVREGVWREIIVVRSKSKAVNPGEEDLPV